MDILTLVASDEKRPLLPAHLEWVFRFVPVEGAGKWLAPERAVELVLGEKPSPAQRRQLERVFSAERIDTFVVSAGQPRRKKMLVCDMDSTVVDGETLDDLAASVGLKEKIAAITRKAMAGELDFPGALRARVAMLEGMPESAVDAELARLRYIKGAWELVRTMAGSGAHCILVSGGFTCFTEVVAKELGFQYHHGNELLFVEGIATGRVSEPILHRHAKSEIMEQYRQRFGLRPEEILAVGDGANDLDMLQAAGLGVGFHPKDFLRERVENSILYGDLTALLYLQGFSRSEFVKKENHQFSQLE